METRMATETTRLRQLVEQRLRVDEVARVEPLGEPGIDWGEEVAGFGALGLIAPEAREARRRAQLKCPRLLQTCDLERAAKEGLSVGMARASSRENELSLQPV